MNLSFFAIYWPRVRCHIVLRRMIFATLLLAASCSRSEVSRPDSSQLQGRWRLENLGGQPLRDTAIQQWEIEFAKDRTWHYTGTMAGLAGMRVSGAGRWYAQNRTLVYSAGDGHGSAVFEISGIELKLRPDPELTNQQHNPVESTYRRLSGFGS